MIYLLIFYSWTYRSRSFTISSNNTAHTTNWQTCSTAYYYKSRKKQNKLTCSQSILSNVEICSPHFSKEERKKECNQLRATIIHTFRVLKIVATGTHNTTCTIIITFKAFCTDTYSSITINITTRYWACYIFSKTIDVIATAALTNIQNMFMPVVQKYQIGILYRDTPSCWHCMQHYAM